MVYLLDVAVAMAMPSNKLTDCPVADASLDV